MRRLRALFTSFLLMLAVATASAQTDDGYIGIYADSAATEYCINIPPFTARTLYVLGRLSGATSPGITSCEFRIEVTNPAGWILSYSPPSADLIIGNPLDTKPGVADSSGVLIVYASCLQPNGNGIVHLGTISAINFGGGLTQLLVRRHGLPSNPTYPCPLFTLCDAPVLSQSCLSPSQEPPCSTVLSSTPHIEDATDPIAFQTSLSSEASGGFGFNASIFRGLEPSDVVFIPSVVDGSMPGSGLATTPNWVAEWDFNDVGQCSPPAAFGWQAFDNRVKNDGSNHWSVTNQFDWAPGIDAYAAALQEVNTCWETKFGGYGNSWDQAIKVTYQAPLSSSDVLRIRFNYYVDSEPGQVAPDPIAFDALTVEADKLCSSFNIDFSTDPTQTAEKRREVLAAFAGQEFVAGHQVSGLADAQLPHFNEPGMTHCVLIRFFSDFGFSPEDSDGGIWGPVAVVIDNLVLELNGTPILTEDFSGSIDPSITLINSADSAPFGNWARLFQHITDNDLCTENGTCAWLFSDDTTPTLFNDPAQSYGPGGLIIKNWLDQVIVSPWVTLTTQEDERTILSFTEFGGNAFDASRITRSWSIRGRDAMGCVSPWPNDEKRRVLLEDFTWRTHLEDISAAVDPTWSDVQIRFRVTDEQFIAPDAPPTLTAFQPGPGPYLDDVRIGRVAFPAPIIESFGGLDTRWQAQDAFPTEPAPIGYWPATSDRFGTCAFSPGQDIARRGAWAPCQISPPTTTAVIGDSILVKVVSLSDLRTISIVEFHGSIVSGPHQGKAPPPYTVNANGFFQVTAQHAFDSKSGAELTDVWFVDLDDDYFRGGDALRYFWYTEDDLGRPSSLPGGIDNPLSTSLAEAEEATGGLFEVNFLPTIEWDPDYLAAIQADPSGGKLDPFDPGHPEWHDQATQQATCILYVNKVNFSRRSGDINRTSFMYTLDRLGYRGSYDVYDVQGFGNTNNDLGSRACPFQAQGYGLLVHDSGTNSFIPIPDGSDSHAKKINQHEWYRHYLAASGLFAFGQTTLWLIGEDIASQTPTALAGDMGFVATTTDVSLGLNPQVQGVEKIVFTWADGSTTNHSSDLVQLHGGCPDVRKFDGLGTSTGLMTHRFRRTGTSQLGPGAIVMKSHNMPNWNSIITAFPWFDVVDDGVGSPTTPTPKTILAKAILDHGLPPQCLKPETVVDVDHDAPLPKETLLHQNYPNPFNPRTRINFDLAGTARVALRVYNVAGRLVRTLVDAEMPAGTHAVEWDGKDNLGNGVASGLYVYRLQAGERRISRKMVVLR